VQSRIFSFEIENAVVNAVFEATDSKSGAKVTLYEWTPAKAERERAKQRLDEVKELISSEVFTADASLYLVVKTPEEGERALAILQGHDLFPGPWGGGKLELVPPVVPPLPPRVIAPVRYESVDIEVPPPQRQKDESKPTSGCAGCAGFAVSVVFIAVCSLAGPVGFFCSLLVVIVVVAMIKASRK
jgi:hypothetical protein